MRICALSFVASWLACATAASAAAAHKTDVEIRAFVNDSCIVADEPYFKPAVESENTERSLALLGLVVGKLTQLIVQHALSTSAEKMTANAARQDTVYAMTHATNLYVATLDPSPHLGLNGSIGCMTIVAAKFRAPAAAECTAEYVPRTLDPASAGKPEGEWTTTRTDDSLQNQLRRANICSEGEPKAVFESRFEFSEDGTAYRLTNAGYRIQSLIGTPDKLAERHVFYTLDINEPGATEKPEHLSTAWIDLGRVMAGQRADHPDNSTPWLRVPPLSVEARRRYEDSTRVQQDTFAQIEAIQRAIVRQQRIDDALTPRIAAATTEVAAGLHDQLVRGQVLIESLNAELAARKSEYAELPRAPLELMPVTIQVGVTESRNEKRALLALAKIIDSSAGSIATAASGVVARDLPARIAPGRSDSGAELQRARSAYYDALIASRSNQPGGAQTLADAKARYNAARKSLGLPPTQL